MRLDRGVFQCRHHLALVTSEDAFRKAVRKLGITESIEFLPGGCRACVQEFRLNEPFVDADSPRRLLFVCIDRGDGCGSLDVISTLIHEAVHCWQKIISYIEEDSPGTEIEAYSVSWISEQLIAAYGGLVSGGKAKKRGKGKGK